MPARGPSGVVVEHMGREPPVQTKIGVLNALIETQSRDPEYFFQARFRIPAAELLSIRLANCWRIELFVCRRTQTMNGNAVLLLVVRVEVLKRLVFALG